MDRRQLGARAESAAREYLLRHGLQPVCENFRCRAGELDLVMLDGAVLALIEVRLRNANSHGGAAASVTARKQTRLIRAAQYLLLKHPELRGRPVRFDVVALKPLPDTRRALVKWIRGAFNAAE